MSTTDHRSSIDGVVNSTRERVSFATARANSAAQSEDESLVRLLVQTNIVMGTAANVFKASALFLGFFGLQFALVPDFLMSENFQSGSYTLDKWHYFVMRGCGCAFLGLAGFYWQTADQADKLMLVSTVTFTLTSIMLPFNAQLNLPVSLPKHYIPVVGCALLMLGHIYCLMNPEAKGKKK